MKRIREAVIHYLKRTDLTLLLLALLIAGVGLVSIYGASRPMANPDRYVTVQALGIGLGVVGFTLASVIDLRRFPRLWIVVLLLNILFQLSLQFFGTSDGTGNKSWIPIAGGLNIQPGEVGKILFIFTLASHMQQLKDKLNHPLSILQLVAHMGVTTLAVFAVSRDMGVAITYPVIFLVMLFASGVSMWWMLAGLTAMVGVAIPLWAFMSEKQQLRILVVFDPEMSDQFAWHAKQSVAALQRGGMTGVGLMNGKAFTNNHNDFIFAALCEQFGFIGGAVLIVLLTLLVFRVFYDGTRSEDLFGRVLCMGVGGMLMFQILINVGMCMGIMPVIGITLPLVSYGGTSVLFTIASLGFVSAARVRRRPDWLRNTE